MKEKSFVQKRKSTRFKPEPGTNTLIRINTKPGHVINAVALVVEESLKGCGLVANHDAHIKAGNMIEVQIGKLAPLSGEIKWVKALIPEIVYFGVSYLE